MILSFYCLFADPRALDHIRESRITGFRDSRQVRHHGRPLSAADGERSQFTRTHVRHRHQCEAEQRFAKDKRNTQRHDIERLYALWRMSMPAFMGVSFIASSPFESFAVAPCLLLLVDQSGRVVVYHRSNLIARESGGKKMLDKLSKTLVRPG